jgi:hypothetical protein
MMDFVLLVNWHRNFRDETAIDGIAL